MGRYSEPLSRRPPIDGVRDPLRRDNNDERYPEDMCPVIIYSDGLPLSGRIPGWAGETDRLS